ncbi:hypothetical protein ABT340_27695 [Streptosporangium sp. NPDC000239]|uniref:hypothetical protein n=1 Tax=Streptosporangium sp. NPDC000239 TaxID=3154248 RepID=UPI003327C02A
MRRSRRAATVSAVLVSVGVCAGLVVANAPFANRTPVGVTRLLAANPSEIPGCDIDPAGPCEEEPTPVVTVTVTSDPDPLPPSPTPQKTVTTTVTVTPSPKPKKPKKPQVPEPTPTPATVETPTTAPVVPDPTPTADPTPSDQAPVFPTTEETQQPTPTPTLTPVTGATPEPTESTTFEDNGPASVPYEIRNAGSDFDAAGLSQRLGIPALVLALLVLFAVLIFEGRLRRLAHASAVRRAGPRGPGAGLDPRLYPQGAAYAPAPGMPPTVYQGGTAYAPIISFVPMQMYAPVLPEGYAPEQYEQPTSYMPVPGQEQPFGQEQHPGYGEPARPEEFTGDAVRPFPQGSERFDGPLPQDPPGVPQRGVPGAVQGDFPGAPFPQRPDEFPGAPVPPGNLPGGTGEFPGGLPGGAGGFPGGPGEFTGPIHGPQGPGEFPGAPFPQEPRDDRRPFGLEPLPGTKPAGEQQPRRPFGLEPLPGTKPEPSGGPQEPQGARRPFGLEPLPPAKSRRGRSKAPKPETPKPEAPAPEVSNFEPPGSGPSGTAVYPLPGEGGKKKRGLFRKK